MAGRITIDVGLNTRDVAKGASDAEHALRDLEDAVGDTGRDGARQLDKVEDELKDVQRQSKRTQDAVGDIDKGTRRAADGMDELKRESDSTAKEAAASWDGTAEGIGDALQEVAANAFAGFGPAGAVAGLAAAAGIGLATAAIQANDEAAQLSKERIADWADAYVEAGERVLPAMVTAARFQDIITDPERFAEAEKNATDWGVSIETAIAAMAGNAGAIKDVEAAVRGLKEEYEAAREAAPPIDEFGAVNGALIEQEQAYRNAAGSLAQLTGEMDAGAQRADLLDSYYRDLINSASSATVEVDELGNAVYTLPDGTKIMIDADTGRATQNVDAFKGDVDGIPETVTTRVKVAVDSSGWDNWRPRLKTGQVYVPGGVRWE